MLFSGVAAAEPAADAQQFLHAKHEAVQKLLKQKPSDKRNSALSKHLGTLLDFDTLAKKSLGSEWTKRSAQEQKSFTNLLRSLVERQYQKNLTNTLEYNIGYAGSEATDDGALVKTVAKSKKKRRAPAIEIDYSMHTSGDEWRVYDVATDGVSLVKNYRRQFRRIIKKDGWNGLLSRMKNKLSDSD